MKIPLSILSWNIRNPALRLTKDETLTEAMIEARFRDKMEYLSSLQKDQDNVVILVQELPPQLCDRNQSNPLGKDLRNVLSLQNFDIRFQDCTDVVSRDAGRSVPEQDKVNLLGIIVIPKDADSDGLRFLSDEEMAPSIDISGRYLTKSPVLGQKVQQKQIHQCYSNMMLTSMIYDMTSGRGRRSALRQPRRVRVLLHVLNVHFVTQSAFDKMSEKIQEAYIEKQRECFQMISASVTSVEQACSTAMDSISCGRWLFIGGDFNFLIKNPSARQTIFGDAIVGHKLVYDFEHTGVDAFIVPPDFSIERKKGLSSHLVEELSDHPIIGIKGSLRILVNEGK